MYELLIAVVVVGQRVVKLFLTFCDFKRFTTMQMLKGAKLQKTLLVFYVP